MRSVTPKQYLNINGRPIIEHTLQRFLDHSSISGVVVCVAADDQVWSTLEIGNHPKVSLADGGQTRADSVLNGLKVLQAKVGPDDWVLVHDAARPCLPKGSIDSLIDTLTGDPVGGILAIPAHDTLKRAITSAKEGFENTPRVESTIDRSTVWLAQTPQMFRFQLLLECLSQALEQGIAITDEASALEWAGHAPRLVPGLTRNIKVTTPDDLALATFLLGQKAVQ